LRTDDTLYNNGNSDNNYSDSDDDTDDDDSTNDVDNCHNIDDNNNDSYKNDDYDNDDYDNDNNYSDSATDEIQSCNPDSNFSGIGIGIDIVTSDDSKKMKILPRTNFFFFSFAKI